MTEQILTFYLCDSLIGINVTLIKEINRNIEYTPVPGAKPHIIGLFNMRGQVVTLFDLAGLIGLSAESRPDRLTCIILKEPGYPDQVGFRIDRPGDVLEIDRNDFESPPANINGMESEYLSGVVKLEDELLLVIDPVKVLQAE